MRTVTFAVPLGIMVDFAHTILSEELSNRIIGDNESGEIVIEVDYTPSQRALVLELLERLDDYREEN